MIRLPRYPALRANEFAAVLGLSRSRFQELVSAGFLPQPRYGKGNVRYWQYVDVMQFVQLQLLVWLYPERRPKAVMADRKRPAGMSDDDIRKNLELIESDYRALVRRDVLFAEQEEDARQRDWIDGFNARSTEAFAAERGYVPLRTEIAELTELATIRIAEFHRLK